MLVLEEVQEEEAYMEEVMEAKVEPQAKEPLLMEVVSVVDQEWEIDLELIKVNQEPDQV